MNRPAGINCQQKTYRGQGGGGGSQVWHINPWQNIVLTRVRREGYSYRKVQGRKKVDGVGGYVVWDLNPPSQSIVYLTSLHVMKLSMH